MFQLIVSWRKGNLASVVEVGVMEVLISLKILRDWMMSPT